MTLVLRPDEVGKPRPVVVSSAGLPGRPERQTPPWSTLQGGVCGAAMTAHCVEKAGCGIRHTWAKRERRPRIVAVVTIEDRGATGMGKVDRA